MLPYILICSDFFWCDLEMVESRNLQGKESRLMMEEFVILLDKHHMPSKLKTGAKVMSAFFSSFISPLQYSSLYT